MFRFISLSSLGLVTLSVMNAGQIQIGAVSGSTNNGLTAAYITGGCAGSNGPNFAGCLAGSTSSNFFREKDYAGTLFVGNALDNSSAVQPTIPSATGSPCNTVTKAAPGCETGGGITYALISDGTTGSTPNNYWNAVGNAGGVTGTLTIPIGVYGVDAAYTMISNQYGLAGVNNTSLQFVFGTASNLTDGGSVTFNLVNGVEVRDANDCTASNGTATDCTAFARTTSSANTTNLYTAKYHDTAALNPAYANTSGNLTLDSQTFTFAPSFLNKYLTELIVTDKNGGGNISRTAFSALTVDVATAATPEPSTVLMFLSGLGAIGLAGLRKAKKQA